MTLQRIAMLSAVSALFGLVLVTGTSGPADAAATRSARCGSERTTSVGGNGTAVDPIAPNNVAVAGHGSSIGTYKGRLTDFDSIGGGLLTIGRCGDAIEGDWRVSRDGGFVGHHYDNLRQLTRTNCRGSVVHMRLAAIERCRMAHGWHVMSIDQQLVSLRSAQPCNTVTLQPELKVAMSKATLERFVNRLKAHGREYCTLFTSGISSNLEMLKRIDPRLITGKIHFGECDRPTISEATANAHFADGSPVLLEDGTHVRKFDYEMLGSCAISAAFVTELHSLGTRVSARSVNTVRAAKRVLNDHIDRIVTDNLATVIPVRNKM